MRSLLRDRQLQGLSLCFLVYAVFTMFVHVFLRDAELLNMVWNAFLSLLPLVFAKGLQAAGKGFRGPHAAALGLLWLFFFPNAPYTVTDFIHENWTSLYDTHRSGSAADFLLWVKFIQIGAGMLLSTLCGLLSLYIVHRLVLAQKGKGAAGLLLTAASLLGGYGIYIGRYLRFNSWDVLHPIRLWLGLLGNAGKFAAAFSLLFACYVFFSYGIFYVLYHERGESRADRQKQAPSFRRGRKKENI